MSTILKFIHTIHFHPLFIFFVVVSFLTGTFWQLIVLFSIIFIHEMSHYVVALYYRWRITSIVIWVFGGVMHTDEKYNRPIKEDILVTVAGPLSHFFIYGLLLILNNFDLLSSYMIDLAFYYNTIIFLFNLLPIYPLDGGKLLLYLLSSFYPFRKAHYYTILLSIIACLAVVLLQIVYFSFTLSAFLLIIFLLLENKAEWTNRYYIFLRFLLNRLPRSMTPFKNKQLFVPAHMSLIDLFALFQRDVYYDIHVTNNDQRSLIIAEETCLHHYFNDKQPNATLWDIIN